MNGNVTARKDYHTFANLKFVINGSIFIDTI